MSATTPAAALATLRQMTESGILDRFCADHGLALLVAFGSAARPESADHAGDLDLAVHFLPNAARDLLGLMAAFAELLGLQRVDVMDLQSASVVARHRALVGTEPLFEHRRGFFAEQQMAAALEFMDTAWLRRLDLELMAEIDVTPRRLDAAVVQVRLRKIRELLQDLQELGEITADRLGEDRTTRHAVERILTAVVDLAVSVNAHVAAARTGEGPIEYAESFHAAARAGAIPEELADELAPSARMRNVLIHQYVDIDLARVAEAAALTPDAYSRYISTVARFLRSAADGPSLET